MHFLVYHNNSKLPGAPAVDQQAVGSQLSFDSRGLSRGFQEDLVHLGTKMSVQPREKAKFSSGHAHPGDSKPPL